MGNPKQKWTSEEEEALRAGVRKHGTGKWKNIQRDPEFSQHLHNRSNIDLKDKWRNLTVSATNGVIPRGGDKLKAQRPKLLTDAPVTPLAAQTPPLADAPVTPLAAQTPPLLLAAPPPASSTSVSKDVKVVTGTEDPSKCILNGKVVSKYNVMIFEALSALNEPNGSDTTAIINYFEKKNEMPMETQKFRKLLTARLRRLVGSEKLIKLPNHCYKINPDTVEGTKNPVPKPTNAQPSPQPKTQLPPQPKAQPPPQPKAQPPTQPKAQLPPQPKAQLPTQPKAQLPPQPKAQLPPQPKAQLPPQPKAHPPPPPPQPQAQVKLQARQVPISGYLGNSVEEATVSAALTVSDAENKSFVLAEAVKEAERVAKMSEETERMLQLAFEISNRSLHGEIVLVV